ncbi:unnamed protein product [Toxocara canis]|uniref:HORMA domain-containing protein n=1 Tax=Toxocara canis TaxID=6265 RepID=A0A183US10_TOXCA|nr:unnamed protein product [Toxocara canis]
MSSRVVTPNSELHYASMDSVMLRRAVQSALRNYYSARIVRPAHMSICIDYTEGAPVDNSLSPFLHYRNPSVVLRMTADEEVHRTEPEQKKPMNREKLLKWIKENCSIADELINDHNEYRPMKAEIRALSSVIPKAVIELESVSKQKATFANLTEVMNLRRKSSRTTTPRSPAPSSSTESKTKDVGTMTSFEEMIDWGEPFGTIDFEPMDSKGRINKGIQARGQTENDP